MHPQNENRAMLSELSASYLSLLRDILINSIYEDPPISPWSQGRFNLIERQGGRDWPSQAFTMVGQRRLDNIQDLGLTVIKEGIDGDFIEAGVWRGGASIFMRGFLKAVEDPSRVVWVADSFCGLPEPDPSVPEDDGDQHHLHKVLSVGLDEVKENFRKLGLLDDRVVFLPGWFRETLPNAPISKLAICRLDGDMFDSTMVALRSLYHKVSPGGFVIVDDYKTTPNCRLAVDRFRHELGVVSPIIDIDDCSVYWRLV